MRDTAPVSFRLKAGEKVQGMTGVVITTQPGIVRVLKKTTLAIVSLKRGDELFLLTNLGEGFSKIWFKGRIFEGDPYDESTYKTIRGGKAVWWVKIKTERVRSAGAGSLRILAMSISAANARFDVPSHWRRVILAVPTVVGKRSRVALATLKVGRVRPSLTRRNFATPVPWPKGHG